MDQPAIVPDNRAITAWLALLAPFAVDQARAAAGWAELTAAYRAPERHYHNLTHLAAVLGWVAALCEDDAAWPALTLAAWFHDAVYDPRAADNEEQSAAWAQRALSELGLPANLVSRVARLILATKTHDVPPGDPAAVILLDADLAILGAEPGAYARYAAAIHREYAWVPEAAYRAGRRAVLARFLARPYIYHTERMRAEREGLAKRNLQAEIDQLV